MVMLCCCPRLLHKTKQPVEEDARSKEESQGLPARPAPARLSPSVPNRLLTLSQSTAAQPTLTNPLPGADADYSIRLAELVIEDSEDENGDDEAAYTHRNRSTSTLEAVKARIRLHLSQDSIPGPTETDEQVARRAEVKRLMRKRIQEELQGENISNHGDPSTLQPPVPPSIVPTGFLNNGPRDTIEFAVEEVTNEQVVERATSAHLSNSASPGVQDISSAVSNRSSTCSSDKENRRLVRSPVSLHDGFENDSKASRSGHRRHVRQRISMPDFLVSPQLDHIRVASLHDTVCMESWRLSLSADRLADLITPEKTQSSFRPPFSPANNRDTINADADGRNVLTSPALPDEETANDSYASQGPLQVAQPGRRLPKSSSLLRDESPVGLWLRAQGQQFQAATASCSEIRHHPDNEVDSQVTGIPLEHIRQIDGIDAKVNSPEPSQSSHITIQKQRAEPAAILSGDEVGTRLRQELSGIFKVSSGRSSADAPLPSTTREASRVPTPLDAGTPLQKDFRRRFAGIKFPSLKCELYPRIL